MKICLINKYFYLKGGSERVLFQEREHLLAAGHTVVDFSMKDPRNEPSPFSDYFVENVDYSAARGIGNKLRAAASFIHSSEAVAKLERLIEAEKPDVAHLHNVYHQLTPSIIPVLKKHGVKVVLTLHDFKLVCPAYVALRHDETVCEACQGSKFFKPLTTHCQNSRARELLLTLEAYFHAWRGSYDGVDLFVSPSRFLADMTTRWRIAPARMRVLRNGVDTAEYQPCYEDDGYALYFGRISKEKGVPTLLAAHAELARSGQGGPVKVVGTGPLRDSLSAAHPEADFPGFKAGEELREIIRRAAFVVVPSEWYENCSMVVLEAMALGKPIIGARVGGIPEQVEHGVSGLLFPMGDSSALAKAMAELWASPEKRVAMGRAGRDRIERTFSLGNHCLELENIYRELLGGRAA